MRIGDHDIGSSRAPYIIAEIGVNHDGRAARARELIEAAAAAGANAVKFQYFTARHLLSRSAQFAKYQENSGAADPFDMLAALELSESDLRALVTFARQTGLDPIVTIFSLEHVPAIHELPWAAFKIASPDIINRPLIEAVADLGKPLILSTGAANEAEIHQSVEWIKTTDFALMQCVSAYPTPTHDAHLGGIGALRQIADVPVGYSDHTMDEHMGALAVAAGAALLEKHITYDTVATGPDHAMSLDPSQFARYVSLARSAAASLGERNKIVHDIEQDVRLVSRQSIVTTRQLPAGHILRREDLTIKRPGIGLAPSQLEDVIGRTIGVSIESDTVLTEDHLSPAAGTKQRKAASHAPANAA